ncbi:FtsQ-type POTRA domain-containing protein [Ruminococcus sp.]|uniref:cell division protein FtsQ/DivIB n=1 Tax=Ruminococcus sp. TaxID=41978 RepID=UPI00388FE051
MANKDKKKRKKLRLFAKPPKKRRPVRPAEPERFDDEDMLIEFSDDTNNFYTDELVERERRLYTEPQNRDSRRDSRRDKRDHKRADQRDSRRDTKPAKNRPEKPPKKTEKRKPLSPAQRKIIRILSYGSIAAVVLIVGVVLSLTVLFKTQVYEVTGITKYSEQEIIDSCGINKGENIFLAPKGAAERRLEKKFPYVEEAKVSSRIPDTIRIAIVEAVEGYLIKVSDQEYLVISTRGRILNSTGDPSAYDLPIFIGPKLTSGAIGDFVSYEDDSVLDMIESITQTFADNGYQGITEIDATNTADISFTYDDRIKVRLGIPEALDYKVRTAMTIISENLDKNQTGTVSGVLDVSRCNSTKRSYFNEEAIRPTEVKPTEKPTEAVSGDGSSGSADGSDGESSANSGEYTGDYTGENQYSDENYSFYAGEEGLYSGYYDGANGDGYYE